jgi:hypothetical protein
MKNYIYFEVREPGAGWNFLDEDEKGALRN